MNLRKVTRRIIVHHSGGPRSQKIEAIRRYHINDKGYEDISYHFVIEEDGRRKRGRDIHLQGAHDAGENADSIGVCLVGNNLDPFQRNTAAQLDSLLELRAALEVTYGPLEFEGHRDRGGDATDCPGFDVRSLLQDR